MDPKVKRLVEQVKAFLHGKYGEGIKRVILYGSHAEAKPPRIRMSTCSCWWTNP